MSGKPSGATPNVKNKALSIAVLAGTGLMIALFLLFLVWLYRQPVPGQQTEVRQLPVPAPKVVEKKTLPDIEVVTDAQPEEQAPIKPRFEFYTILPELEVVVPDEQAAKALKRAPVPRPVAPVENNTPKATVREPAAASATATTTAAQPEFNNYVLQAGSFQSQEDAERQKVNLLLMGLNVSIQPVQVQNKQWYRVRVGPFKDFDSYADARSRLTNQGIDFMVLRLRN